MTRSPSRRDEITRRVSGSRAGSAEVVAATSSTLDVDFGSAPPWSAWDLMPTDVLRAVEDATLQPLAPYVTGAKEPRVRKRGDDFLERAYGWAVDRRVLIVLDAVRRLEPLDGGRFRPVEPWRLSVRQRPFVGEVKERSGTVHVDARLATGRGPTDGQAWVDVIDVLPAPVRKQILATVPNPEIDFDTLTQGYDKGVPSDHEAGLVRVAAGQMIALKAIRRISVSRRMTPSEGEGHLAEAPWDVMTVTARLGAEHVTELSTDRNQSLSVSAPRRDALPSSTTDPVSRG